MYYFIFIHLVEEKIAIFAAANSNDFTKSNAKYQLGTDSSAYMKLQSHHSYISHSQKAVNAKIVRISSQKEMLLLYSK